MSFKTKYEKYINAIKYLKGGGIQDDIDDITKKSDELDKLINVFYTTYKVEYRNASDLTKEQKDELDTQKLELSKEEHRKFKITLKKGTIASIFTNITIQIVHNSQYMSEPVSIDNLPTHFLISPNIGTIFIKIIYKKDHSPTQQVFEVDTNLLVNDVTYILNMLKDGMSMTLYSNN